MTKQAEPAERRREPRFDVARGAMTPAGAPAGAPATDGHACLDWSRTGFRVAARTPDGRNLLPDEHAAPFAFTLRIEAALGRISVKGTGTVVRRTDAFVAGTWTVNDPSGPNAALAAAILDAFMAAGPGEP